MSIAYEQQASTALQQLGQAIAEKQLDQAAQQAAASAWSYTHFLGYLLDAELRFRHEKTVRLNLQFASLAVGVESDAEELRAARGSKSRSGRSSGKSGPVECGSGQRNHTCEAIP